MKDKIFSIDTGKVYDALPAEVSKDKKVISSDVLERTEKLIFVAEDRVNNYFIFKNDPGRRNSSLVGRFLRDVLSANNISKNAILFQIRDGDGVKTKFDQYYQKSYWTVLAMDEMILDVPEALNQLTEERYCEQV